MCQTPISSERCSYYLKLTFDYFIQYLTSLRDKLFVGDDFKNIFLVLVLTNIRG